MNLEVSIKIEHGSLAKPAADVFYKTCGSAAIVNSADTLVCAYLNNQIVGIVRLCFENGHYVLRTMRVRNDLQGKGIGGLVLDKFEGVLTERGIRETYCIPYAHLEPFYGRIGFHKIQLEEAPIFLQNRLTKMKAEHPENNYILMNRTSLKNTSSASV